MSVVIRMKRTGRTNRPSFRISVADSRDARDGRTIESLGYYDPASPKPELRLKLDAERARYWVSKGARPSLTVSSILRRLGVTKDLPPRKKNAPRPGRKKVTKVKARRRARQEALEAQKAVRRAERLKIRRAAARAAKAAAAPAAEKTE